MERNCRYAPRLPGRGSRSNWGREVGRFSGSQELIKIFVLILNAFHLSHPPESLDAPDSLKLGVGFALFTAREPQTVLLVGRQALYLRWY